MARKKTLCDKCNHYISNSNFNKHHNSCTGIYKTKEERGECAYCKEKFDLTDKKLGWMANHVRWCEENPKSNEYRSNLSGDMHHARAAITPETRKRMGISISLAHTNGKYSHIDRRTQQLGKRHSEETKKKISDSAKKANYQRVCKKSHLYTDKLGRIFTFDSSWEDLLANRLDDLDIKWIRPDPIIYTDCGRKYYGDFYLIDYDLYLDPKNLYIYKQQIPKLIAISKMVKLILLHSPEECKFFSLENIESKLYNPDNKIYIN